MAINFSVGEYVVINRAWVEKILGTLGCSCNQQTLSSLGYIGANPSEVLETGSVFAGGTTKSYIKIRPSSTKNPAYNNGAGTIILFCSDNHLNNSLELSTAFVDDTDYVKAQNVSGAIINKGSLVYQSGFDATLQLPNIDLASAAAASTSAVLGIAAGDIAIGESGSILISGSFNGLDTSAFTNVGQNVYLSDTPGAISVAAGTVERVTARIAIISATDGTILLDTLAPSGGGGGGGAGATGIQGVTGILGIDGQTGIQGNSGQTGIQGITGIGAGSVAFFTDGVGTNAGIGKGATPPTASGTNSLAQGDTVDVTGNNSLGQGANISITADRCFAHGEYVNAIRADQKTFGSNRTSSIGSAQSSHIIKHVSASGTTVTTLATLNLEVDKTYSITCNIVGRDTTTNGNNVSYILSQALAYRDVAGSAVLVGSPTFTQVSVGGGATTTATISSSVNDILIRVSGNLGQTFEWCCDLSFTEVQG